MSGTEKVGGPDRKHRDAQGAQANVDRDIFELIKEDLSVELLILLGGEFDKRNQLGWHAHGKKLTAHDGTDSLRDALDEYLDAAVYLRKAMVEQGNPGWLVALYRRAIQVAAQMKMRIPV